MTGKIQWKIWNRQAKILDDKNSQGLFRQHKHTHIVNALTYIDLLCVCVYIYIYIYTHTHTHKHTHTHIYIYIYIYMIYIW